MTDPGPRPQPVSLEPQEPTVIEHWASGAVMLRMPDGSIRVRGGDRAELESHLASKHNALRMASETLDRVCGEKDAAQRRVLELEALLAKTNNALAGLIEASENHVSALEAEVARLQGNAPPETEKPIYWRGSVSDLVTDIAAHLTPLQLGELAGEAALVYSRARRGGGG